jgi:regulatory protein
MDKGNMDPADLLEAAQQPAQQGRSRKRAMKILGSRLMSAHEMEKRLVTKGESTETAQETVRWLEDIGAVNDTEYAEAIVRHYCTKGYGIARVKDELYKRGIARDLWDDALSGFDGMEDAAYMYLTKKLKGSSDRDDLRRAVDALCRRGFSYEEARATVRKYIEENGMTEDTEQ